MEYIALYTVIGVIFSFFTEIENITVTFEDSYIYVPSFIIRLGVVIFYPALIIYIILGGKNG